MNDTVLFVLVISSLFVLLCVSAFRLGATRKQLDVVRREIDELKTDLNVFNDGAQGIGRRLVEAERQLKSVADDQAQLMQQASGQSYTDAANLVAQGVGVDEIVDRCGMSKAEVELMILLHDKEQAPA